MPQKSTLSGDEFFKQLSSQIGVNTISGRNSYIFNADGPVLAAYPRVEDLGTIVGSRGITALCVVRRVDSLKIWIQETKAEVLTEERADNDSSRDEEESLLAPEIRQALEYMGMMVNCNNAISGGYEKKIVIRQLLKLHDEGIYLPGNEMAEWVASRGWKGENCSKLREFAAKINNGIRPRYNA